MGRKGSWTASWIVALGVMCLACGGGLKQPQTIAGARLLSAPVAFHLLRDAAGLLIFDLRTELEYISPRGHLRGAVNFPLAELERRLAGLRIPSSSGVLVYCRAADDCGAKGVQLFLDAGFENVFLLADGIEGWLAAGLGVADQPLVPVTEN